MNEANTDVKQVVVVHEGTLWKGAPVGEG